MKKVLLISVFCQLIISSAFCQTEALKQEVKVKMWKANDPDFKITEINAEFKDESAVIICRKMEYEVKKDPIVTYLHENYYLHERVKLLDKAAVENYSELEFNFSNNLRGPIFAQKNNHYFVGVKVIKPDGTEKEVDVSNAVTEKIEQGYRNYSVNKIAVADLEQGDIIDYYYVTKHTTYNNVAEAFDPWLYLLTQEYPVMKHKVELRTMRKCFLNAKSLNEAPDFIKTEDDKSNTTYYTLEQENIPKGEIERWQYPYREYPAIKFQAFYFSSKGKNQANTLYKFVDKKNIVRKKYTKEEIINLISVIMVRQGKGAYLKIYNYLRENFPKEKDVRILVREALNYLRQFEFQQSQTKYGLYSGDGYDPKNIMGEPLYISGLHTASVISAVLRDKSIPYEVFITTTNELGTINDFIIPADLIFGIKVNGENPIYISGINQYSTIGELPPSLHGNKALAVDLTRPKPQRVLKEITLPEPKADYSVQRVNSHISFNPESMDSLYVKRNTTISGFSRYFYQNNFVLQQEYADDSKNEEFGIRSLEDRKIRQKKKEEILERKQEIHKQEIEDRIERAKKLLISEYDIKDIKVNHFELMTVGMWSNSPALVYEEDITIGNFINKVGPNYMLEVGKLIGGQVQLDNEETKERNTDIYNGYARTFEENLEIVIPDGYQPAGIEDLNVNVKNDAGSFVSIASVKDGVLKIETKKTYNQAFLPKEKWSSMIEFLNEAYNFTQKKILLQRK